VRPHKHNCLSVLAQSWRGKLPHASLLFILVYVCVIVIFYCYSR
jgi:hypothetical protein